MPDLNPIFRDKRLAFFDLDGTVCLGSRLLPGAKDLTESLAERGCRVYFLTNNSSRSKSDYADRLAGLGISASEGQFILSTDGLIAYLLERGIRDVYTVGTASMQAMLRASGFQPESSRPKAVVLGYDTELTYSKLQKAALYLLRGIPLLATHPDLVCPSPEGPIPDVGAMLALFEKATGVQPERIFGKPHPDMVRHVLDRHGIGPESTVMIGDRIYTDMELARRLACDSILVLSGESRREDLAGVVPPPTLVVENLAGLLEPD